MTGDTRTSLRRRLRQARRALSPAQQHQASRKLYRQLAQHPLFLRSRHIAFYLANDGEIDPALLMAHARQLGKQCYLPVISGWPADRMHFQQILPGQHWVTNRFGIREPRVCRSRQVRPWRLSMVLMPLVGFDTEGNRLGMGGGFYDRTFAYRRWRPRWRGAKLVGLAHSCQKVSALPIASWDIPLDGIISDTERLIFSVPR
ncbi:MAG TPA: 5-formyltetrahydrofolate cyclo-ligase [Pseudomonas xinjiangensis]|uniref:5-formyltetrahydrofolate cyclo-ligase n=2 Tax=root TaxID=1 RepID=A0A7V1FSE3_9GAMM|nr:5-formyltetrahydrofolate cyclo-ligase [Halopseudomonas xinjiangensis]HEC48506.1 5-formyltetrahydrofolate cyclo-ligase [Halopseudomonas xinjiangensis]